MSRDDLYTLLTLLGDLDRVLCPLPRVEVGRYTVDGSLPPAMPPVGQDGGGRAPSGGAPPAGRRGSASSRADAPAAPVIRRDVAPPAPATTPHPPATPPVRGDAPQGERPRAAPPAVAAPTPRPPATQSPAAAPAAKPAPVASAEPAGPRPHPRGVIPAPRAPRRRRPAAIVDGVPAANAAATPARAPAARVATPPAPRSRPSTAASPPRALPTTQINARTTRPPAPRSTRPVAPAAPARRITEPRDAPIIATSAATTPARPATPRRGHRPGPAPTTPTRAHAAPVAAAITPPPLPRARRTHAEPRPDREVPLDEPADVEPVLVEPVDDADEELELPAAPRRTYVAGRWVAIDPGAAQRADHRLRDALTRRRGRRW